MKFETICISRSGASYCLVLSTTPSHPNQDGQRAEAQQEQKRVCPRHGTIILSLSNVHLPSTLSLGPFLPIRLDRWHILYRFLDTLSQNRPVRPRDSEASCSCCAGYRDI